MSTRRYGNRIQVTIPIEGFIAVPHRCDARIVACAVWQDPFPPTTTITSSGVVELSAFDVQFNNGKFLTVAGSVGQSCIVSCVSDMSVLAQSPNNDPAPVFTMPISSVRRTARKSRNK